MCLTPAISSWPNASASTISSQGFGDWRLANSEEQRLERARKAAAYIESYVRSHHEDLKVTFRDTAPGAGYGRYAGYEVVKDVGTFLFHFTDEKFLNAKIPADFASPEALRETLRSYIDQLGADLGRLEDVFKPFIAKQDLVPENASHLFAAVRNYKHAAEQAMKLMADEERGEIVDIPKAAPANWANKTSAIVAVVFLLSATVASFTKLVLENEKLKDRVTLIEQKLATQPGPVGDEAEMRRQVCVKLIDAYTSARDSFSAESIEAYDSMLRRAGCTT